MSATSVTIERARRTGAVAHEAPRLIFGGILAVGAVLLLLASMLTLLVAMNDVPAAGHPGTWHQVTKLVVTMPLLLLGALMIARLPRNAIGWILCGTSLGTAIAVAAQEYATYSHFVDGLPAEPWIGWLGEWAGGPTLAILTVALLLFPTGRLPSRRWRPVLWLGIAGPLLVWLGALVGAGEDLLFLDNPISNNHVLHEAGNAGGIGWFLMLPAAGFGIASLVVRRRTATGETREQLRLLLQAGVVVMLAFLACMIGSFIAPLGHGIGASLWWVSLGFLAGTMGVAILRHRLYGLDVYVNRTLVYTGLTVVLGGLYVAVVLGLGRLLGENASLGITLPAAASVAVAFQPLRDRLQRSVNRLLYGQRDEPYAAISSLGRRLGEAIGQTEVLSAMVDTIADALRLPYVAVELASSAGLAAVHGTPAAGVALRLPLVHGGERVGTLDHRSTSPRRNAWRGRPSSPRGLRPSRGSSRERGRTLERSPTLTRAARVRAGGGAAAAQRRPARRPRAHACGRDSDDRGGTKSGHPRSSSGRRAARPSSGEHREHGRRHPSARLRVAPTGPRPARARPSDPPAGIGALHRR